MRDDDFFQIDYDLDGSELKRSFDVRLIKRMKEGPIPEFTDLEIAEALCTLLPNELIKYATYGDNILSNDEMKELLLCGRAVSRRLRIEFPDLPFRDLDSFERFWKSEGMTWTGSWGKRRDWVQSAFAPYDVEVSRLVQNVPDSTLLRPITQTNDPMWRVIDDEVVHLRQRFTEATTVQDYNAVGLVCVRIQESLGMIAFDPAKHWTSGQPLPAKGNTKDKFEAIVETVLVGRDNATLRGLVRKAIEFAQGVKHASAPTRQEAAIACDSTLFLVGTIRNLVDPPT